MVAMLYNRLKDAESSVRYSNEYVQDDEQAALARISANSLDRAKREVLESHAQEHPMVRRVLDGGRTFYELGEPIIKNCMSVEEIIAGRKFAYVSKNRLLGKDARDVHDVREAVDFLKSEEIIDSGRYLTSHMIFPDLVSKPAEAVEWVKKTHPGKIILFGVGLPVALGAYAGFHPFAQFLSDEGDNERINLAAGAFGTFFLVWAPLYMSGLLQTSNKLTEQRKNFEGALKFMDGEVGRLFPDGTREGQLERVVA